MIWAVIDTNFILCDLLCTARSDALILPAVYQGLTRPCFSGEIIAEYVGALARPKFVFAPGDIEGPAHDTARS